MLSFNQLSLRRGPRLLFQDVTFAIHPGQKVGITGANGCGKSSLFALVRGELQADTGSCSLPPQWVIAHVAQETPAVERAAVDYVIDGDTELREVERELAQAEADNDGHRQAELHGRLDHIGGYGARARAARLMHGLGFRPGQEEASVSSFSGGWRMRLNLARALMCRSDLLLLDEPTNHLDLDAVIWLQEWLRAYPGTLLLISHDRDFLDEVTDQIAHVEAQGIRLYSGNYSDFERQRAAHLAQQQAAHEKQQREREHMHRFVERFRAKATKARQAQSRLKALARMEEIAPAHVDSPFHFQFLPPHKLPTPLLSLEQAAAGYGETPVIGGVRLGLMPGDRLGLLGPNGAGKSTLIKLLAGELVPLQGKREPARELAIGYFAQHQLEQLRGDDTPFGHLQRLDPRAREQSLRDFLGGFGFHGEMVDQPVAPLSGGEKARLVLALLVWQRPNLLLLDEPTNHLDLEMRHALAVALQEFEGAMVVVSHDRHLLRMVCDEFRLVADGRCEAFDGDLTDYAAWLASRRTPEADEDAPQNTENSATARKEKKRQEAELRQKLQPLKREVEKQEQAMARLGEEKSALEAKLAEPDLYSEEARETLKALLLEKGKVDQALAEAEEAWLEASEALEEAQAGSEL